MYQINLDLTVTACCSAVKELRADYLPIAQAAPEIGGAWREKGDDKNEVVLEENQLTQYLDSIYGERDMTRLQILLAHKARFTRS
jgi:hypothetical protein